MENQEFITSVSQEYFLPEQNCSSNVLMIQRLGDNHLEQLREQEEMRRGEHIVLREKTEKLFPFPSRFWHLQPDGSNKKISWCARHDSPATYQILKTWKWTGKRFIEC